MKTDSAGQNRHYLRIRRHLGSEENHRNEHEQRTEHVHEIRHEVDIIIKDYRPQRSFLAYEIIYLLAYVEYYHDTDNQQQSDKEGQYELLYDIGIEYLRLQSKILKHRGFL